MLNRWVVVVLRARRRVREGSEGWRGGVVGLGNGIACWPARSGLGGRAHDDPGGRGLVGYPAFLSSFFFFEGRKHRAMIDLPPGPSHAASAAIHHAFQVPGQLENHRVLVWDRRCAWVWLDNEERRRERHAQRPCQRGSAPLLTCGASPSQPLPHP